MSAYEVVLKHLIDTGIRYAVSLGLIQKFSLLLGEDQQLISQYELLKAQFDHLLNQTSSIPQGADMAMGLSITPLDFGYSSWNSKTPDSSFFETYRVYSHLANPAAASISSDPARFPDFLFVGGPSIQDYRGVSEWFYSGLRDGFPTGSLAAEGFQSWVSRAIPRIELLFDFLKGVRAIAWPKGLKTEKNVEEI